jgi:hypothetical protein
VSNENGGLGLSSPALSPRIELRHEYLNRAISQLFAATDQLKSIEPVVVSAGVQEAYERADHCLLADDGQDLCAAYMHVCSISE